MGSSSLYAARLASLPGYLFRGRMGKDGRLPISIALCQKVLIAFMAPRNLSVFRRRPETELKPAA